VFQSFDTYEVTGIICPTQRILTAGWSQVIRVYIDSKDNPDETVVQWSRQHTDDIAALAFSPPSTVITGSHDGYILVWSLETGRVIVRLNASVGQKPINVKCDTRNYQLKNQTKIVLKSAGSTSRQSPPGQSSPGPGVTPPPQEPLPQRSPRRKTLSKRTGEDSDQEEFDMRDKKFLATWLSYNTRRPSISAPIPLTHRKPSVLLPIDAMRTLPLRRPALSQLTIDEETFPSMDFLPQRIGKGKKVVLSDDLQILESAPASHDAIPKLPPLDDTGDTPAGNPDTDAETQRDSHQNVTNNNVGPEHNVTGQHQARSPVERNGQKQGKCRENDEDNGGNVNQCSNIPNNNNNNRRLTRRIATNNKITTSPSPTNHTNNSNTNNTSPTPTNATNNTNNTNNNNVSPTPTNTNDTNNTCPNNSVNTSPTSSHDTNNTNNNTNQRGRPKGVAFLLNNDSDAEFTDDPPTSPEDQPIDTSYEEGYVSDRATHGHDESGDWSGESMEEQWTQRECTCGENEENINNCSVHSVFQREFNRERLFRRLTGLPSVLSCASSMTTTERYVLQIAIQNSFA
jgi:hypothetical protein